jgi:hypothetical protein
MLALTWASETLESRYFLDSETGAVLLDSPAVRELPEDFEDHDIEPMWCRKTSSG